MTEHEWNVTAAITSGVVIAITVLAIIAWRNWDDDTMM